jgi:hypothetical protein
MHTWALGEVHCTRYKRLFLFLPKTLPPQRFMLVFFDIQRQVLHKVVVVLVVITIQRPLSQALLVFIVHISAILCSSTYRILVESVCLEDQEGDVRGLCS